jgi:hypothetical protein
MGPQNGAFTKHHIQSVLDGLRFRFRAEQTPSPVKLGLLEPEVLVSDRHAFFRSKPVGAAPLGENSL